MKRAVIVGTTTVAGIAAVLALNPDPATPTASAATVQSGSSGSGSSSSGSSSSGSPSDSGSSSSSASGTYTGDAVDIGRGYGTIQLEVTVESGRIVDIQALAVPENDHRSAEISSYSVPQLIQQALDAQSAQISGISGATYTSYGFAQSLTSALQQAGL